MKKIKKKKTFKEFCIDEDIAFLQYLNYDLHFKYWSKPSKIFLIDNMIKNMISKLRLEKMQLNDNRR